MRSQELVSGERLQSEVSGPFCCQPLLGCIDGSSVRRGQERISRQVVTDDLQAASQWIAGTGRGCVNGKLLCGMEQGADHLGALS